MCVVVGWVRFWLSDTPTMTLGMQNTTGVDHVKHHPTLTFSFALSAFAAFARSKA